MLDGMNKKFIYPYVVFYPVLSRDGMPFPINKCLKEIQGPNYRENLAWRGNLVIAKYRDEQLSTLMDATMADFPLLKNYLSTHFSPVSSVSPFLLLHHTFSRRFSKPFHCITSPHVFWIVSGNFSCADSTLPHLRAHARATSTSCHEM
jgi:hypothetical protein